MSAESEWLVCLVGEHPVYVWGGYGVVMPSRLTSNGNARMIAIHIVLMLADGYKVTDSALPADTRFGDVDALAAALREFRARREAGLE